MGDGEAVDDGMKCDYCSEDAVLKFRLMKIVRSKGRLVRMWGGQYMAGCSKHLDNAIRAASAEIRR